MKRNIEEIVTEESNDALVVPIAKRKATEYTFSLSFDDMSDDEAESLFLESVECQVGVMLQSPVSENASTDDLETSLPTVVDDSTFMMMDAFHHMAEYQCQQQRLLYVQALDTALKVLARHDATDIVNRFTEAKTRRIEFFAHANSLKNGVKYQQIGHASSKKSSSSFAETIVEIDENVPLHGM